MSLLDESGLTLLEKARERRKAYNWLEAVRLFDRAVDYYIDKKDPEILKSGKKSKIRKNCLSKAQDRRF